MEEFSEFSSEGGCKLGSAVRDNFIEKSKEKEDFVEKEGGDPFSSDGFLHGAKNYPLSKPMVYHDQERIEAGGHREVGDKVAGDLLERARGGGFDGREGGYGGMCVNLVLLAKGIAFDIATDERSKAGPPEFGGDKLLGFQEAGGRSRRRERASGPARSFPGTWTILRSKSARSMSQRAWRRFSA